jgi:transcriptional regulator with GAF, ATPase, and Fis domain
VFRLAAESPVIIGRSSQSQVAIRSEGASRSHAEVAFADGAWTVKDLASRNGTFVNGIQIEGLHHLEPGDTITVAGFHMTFVLKVADAFGSDPTLTETGQADETAKVGEGRAEAGLTVDTGVEADSKTQQQIDPTIITERRRTSRFLDGKRSSETSSKAAAGETLTLFRTAYDLARSQSPEQAAETTLEAIHQATGTASGAILVSVKRKSETPVASFLAGMTALSTRSRQQRSYRRLPDKIASSVLESGEAILARNIVDDLALSSPDSRGELSTTSTLCAPIPVSGKNIGILHVYSSDDEPELTPEHLELALALAAHLGVALEHLWHRRQLSSHLRRSQQQVALLREQLGDRVQIIGQSEPVLLIEQQVARAAPTNATVLIRGESGVGKELVAAAIHHASPRRDGPFVCLNCAALSPSLLESELFGHEKGAFTGATERKIGKFEAADGGTLMLDEIGEMNPEIQAKFLRVLEGHAFERVGGNTPIRSDVRVVAATNRNLEEAVHEGVFRSDLFFRLHVLELRIPALRERGADVLLLANHFLERFSKEMGRRFDGFTEGAKRKLLGYRWPGNIRELKNTIERAVVLSAGPEIDSDDLLLSQLRLPGTKDQDALSSDANHVGEGTFSFDSLGIQASETEGSLKGGEEGDSDVAMKWVTMSELEQQYIAEILKHTGGNKSQAAKILGIERSTLDRKLKRYESE